MVDSSILLTDKAFSSLEALFKMVPLGDDSLSKNAENALNVRTETSMLKIID